jgi:hypothetical protein
MRASPARSSEHDIAVAVMKYLATLPSRKATTASIKRHIPSFIKLTRADKQPSITRPMEQLWHQVVGNIVSHRADSPENFVNRDLLTYDRGWLTLTEAGSAYLQILRTGAGQNENDRVS